MTNQTAPNRSELPADPATLDGFSARVDEWWLTLPLEDRMVLHADAVTGRLSASTAPWLIDERLNKPSGGASSAG